MKKVSLLMVFLLAASILFAQADKNKKRVKQVKRARTIMVDPAKVPQAVKDAQTKQFTDVQKIRWQLKAIRTKKGPAKDFIATFKGKDGIVKAHYKPDGTPLLTIHHLKADKIPSNVASVAKKNYPGFGLKRGDKIEVFAKNILCYRLILTKPSAKLILYTDKNGNDAKKANEIKEALGDGDGGDSDMD